MRQPTLILPATLSLTMVMAIMPPFRLSMTPPTTPMMMFFLLVYLHLFAFLYNPMFHPQHLAARYPLPATRY